MTTLTQYAKTLANFPFEKIAPPTIAITCEYLLAALDYAAAMQGNSNAYENALHDLHHAIGHRLQTGHWYTPEKGAA